MAIAAEALAPEAEEAAGAAAGAASSRAASQRGGSPAGTVKTLKGAYRPVSSPSKLADTLTRLLWAVALGLIVLEIASEATGQFWDFSLPARGTLTKQPYQPLYGAQDLQIANAQQQATENALVGLGLISASPGRSGSPGAIPLGVARG